jgi:hypothetical protein
MAAHLRGFPRSTSFTRKERGPTVEKPVKQAPCRDFLPPTLYKNDTKGWCRNTQFLNNRFRSKCGSTAKAFARYNDADSEKANVDLKINKKQKKRRS